MDFSPSVLLLLTSTAMGGLVFCIREKCDFLSLFSWSSSHVWNLFPGKTNIAACEILGLLVMEVLHQPPIKQNYLTAQCLATQMNEMPDQSLHVWLHRSLLNGKRTVELSRIGTFMLTQRCRSLVAFVCIQQAGGGWRSCSCPGIKNKSKDAGSSWLSP